MIALAQPLSRTHNTASLMPVGGALLQRKCSCGGSAGLTGKCDECEKKKLATGALQKKLTVNEPGDAYEQEADRVAEGVMRMPTPVSTVSQISAPTISRAATGGGGGAEAPGIVHDVLRSSGQPLDARTRGFMEPRFGHDFSGVRVHTDARAAESARAVNALAYTVGRDVVFGEGQYAPGSGSGQRLLAHELTHVVQQGGGVPNLTPAVNRQRLAHDGQTGKFRGGVADGPAPLPISVGSIGLRKLSRTAAGKGTPKPAGTSKGVALTVTSAYMASSHVVVPDAEYTSTEENGEPAKLQSFTIDQFVMPGSKGPNAAALYKQLAKAGALAATLDVQSGATKAILWQERAVTDELRDRWLQRIGWPGGTAANALWQKAGGDSEFPKVGGATCQMDHIVELQVGGNNTNENIQPLDAEQNRNSGGAIKQEVFQLAKQIIETRELSNGNASQVTLRFRTVTTDGAMETLPAKCPAAKPTCLSVGKCAASIPVPKGSAPIAETEPYQIRSGAATTIHAPNGFSKAKSPKPVDILGAPINEAAAELIPGFLLTKLNRKNEADTIDARIDDRAKTRLPITISDKRGRHTVFNVSKVNGSLTIDAAHSDKGIEFQYPNLSPGVINKLETTQDGHLQFDGTIHSTVPLLGSFDVSYRPDRFTATKDLTEKTIKSPIPGLRITKAGIGIQLWPEFKPSGTIEFEVGSKEHPLATGSIVVSADAEGFVANGHLIANIPGMDKAEGDVTYRPKQGWSGKIELKTSKAFVKSVSAVVAFDDKGLSVTGGATIMLPGDKTADLVVSKDEKTKKWVFSGSATIDVPGGRVKPVEITFHYDGEKVNGKGHTTFTLGAHSGDITIVYDDGKVSGEGSIAVKTSRVSGKIHVKLSQAQKFSGEGELTVQIAKNLIGTIGVAIDENGKTKAKGGFEFTEPYVLFKRFGGDYQIFKTGVSIPIPGLSIGPLGVKVAINGALSAGYHVGPGELRGIKAMGTADDLTSDNVALDLMLEGQLYIGGGAHITGSIEGAIMLDVGLASASGGLRISASAVLEGSMLSGVKVHYTKGRFEVDADFNLLLALALKLGLGAFVQAQAGIGPFKVETRKDWTLASYTFDTGLKLGVRTRKPIHYASDKPFAPPGLDQIEVTKPNIDVQNMLAKIFLGAPSKEIKT